MARILKIFIAVFVLTATTLTAQKTITFIPSDGVTLTKADVDSTLAKNDLTRDDEFHAIIEDATQMEHSIFDPIGIFQQTGILSVSSSSLINLGDRNFRYCTKLVSASFPNATYIGWQTFKDCSGLITADFPVLERIDHGSNFEGCVSLSTISFGTNFKELTEIQFTSPACEFGCNSDITKNVDLILGELVLPLPDLSENSWQFTYYAATKHIYTWKSIQTVGINEIIKDRTVSTYPNPATDFFTVSFELEKSCSMEIILFDILGNKIRDIHSGFAVEGFFNRIVNVNDLNEGVYFIQISVGRNFIIKKIVVN